MVKIIESVVEEVVISWFEELGYGYVYGFDIIGEVENFEWDDYCQVVLKDCLFVVFKCINFGVLVVVFKKVVFVLFIFENFDLVQFNMGFYWLLFDGVCVMFVFGGQQEVIIVKVVDFDNEINNDWLVVNQFIVQGFKYNCCLDVVVFFNGLFLVVFELKNLVDENVDIWMVFDQVQNYKNDIKVLFYYNVFSVILDFFNVWFGFFIVNKE